MLCRVWACTVPPTSAWKNCTCATQSERCIYHKPFLFQFPCSYVFEFSYYLSRNREFSFSIRGQVQLPFPDNQLVSHEPTLLRFHQDFTLTPLLRVAQSSYPDVLQSLLAVRAKAKRARAAINTLQADIASQREAGDLDRALLSQERLVSRLDSSAIATNKKISKDHKLLPVQFTHFHSISSLSFLGLTSFTPIPRTVCTL